MISFIVPAYNEERCLPATLQALHAAGRALDEPYEIVVADDASTDQTAAIAAAHGVLPISVAYRQIAATRNAGARAARGACLIFVDADTLVNAEVVRAAVQALRAGAVGGGAGMVFDHPTPRYARALLWLTVRLFRLTGYAAGCFVYCRREAFDAVGGFDERYFGAEELVLSRALKRQGRFVILKETVTTSARKLRTYSHREVLKLFAALLRGGPRVLRGRQGMELWYAERRDDPRQGP